MALNDKYISLPFQGGLETERNEKTVPIGKLTTLRNGVFTQDITIEKRFGSRVLTKSRTGTTYSIVSGTLGLATRDDGHDLTMLASTDEVLSYDDATSGWTKRGDWTSLQLSTRALPHRPFEAWDHTTTSYLGTRIVAWQDARGGVRAQLFNADGVAYAMDYLLGTGDRGSSPKAVTVGSNFHVWFVSGSGLFNAVVSPVTPTAMTSTIIQVEQSLVAFSGSTLGNCPVPYSVVSRGSDAVAAWSTVTGTTNNAIKVAMINADGNVGLPSFHPARPAPLTFFTASAGPVVAVTPDNQYAAVVWTKTVGSGLTYSIIYLPNFSMIVTDHPFDSDPVLVNGGLRRLSAGWTTSNVTLSSSLQVVAEVSSSATTAFGLGSASATANIPGDHVRVWTIAPDGAHLQRKFGSRLASDVFSMGGRNHAWMTQVTQQQSTDYLVRLDDCLDVARSRPGLCVAGVSGTLSSVDVSDDGLTFVRAATQRETVSVVGTSGSSFLARDGVLCTLNYHVSSSWQPQDVDGVLVMPGGWLGSYDGIQTTELGFSMAVEGLVAVPGSGSIPSAFGSGLAIPTLGTVINGSASYEYAVVPEWFDAMGNRHLGACAYPAIVQLTGTTDTTIFFQNSASLAWSSIPHTMKDGVRAPSINFAVFRTSPNGTVLQRVDDPRYPIVNPTGSSIVVWYDTTPESVRAQGEVLYTQAEGQNSMPLAATIIAQGGDRIYLAGVEGEPNTIVASKLRVGGAVAFTDGDEISVDARGGPLTALDNVDDTMVAFKESRIFSFPDSGPSNGLFDTTEFPIPQFETSDVGIPMGSFAVPISGQTSQGLMFRSLRGFRMLDRGINLINVGAAMKAFDGLTLTAGLSPKKSEEARFYSAEGTTQVLNTRFDQWGTFDSQPAVAACLWRGSPTYASADGRVWVEDTGSYTDAGASYEMVIETGWLPLQGLQGLSRVRQLFLLGDYWSSHTLRTEMAFDYNDTYVFRREIDVDAALGVFPYGGSLTTQITGAISLDGAFAFEDLGPDGSEPTTWVRAANIGQVGNTYDLLFSASLSAPATGSFTTSGTLTTWNFVVGVSTVGNFEAGLLAGGAPLLTMASASVAPSTVIVDSPIAFINLAGGVDPYQRDSFDSGSYGGADPVYQFRFDMPFQRMQALRLRFSDADADGRSFSLTELKLRVATESDKARLPFKKIR